MARASDIEAQAADWLVRRDAAGGGDLPGFEEWLEADPRHRAAFIRLETAWRRADRLRAIRPLEGPIDEHLLCRAGHPKPRWPAPWLGGLAASALLALIAAVWTVLDARGWHSYATNLGEYSRVVLPDGSLVDINSGSRLRVRLTEESRHVTLDEGEARFQVAHDPSRPFEVDAGGTRVRALGTAFSVRLRNGRGVEVVVTEGRVTIDPPGGQARAGRHAVTSEGLPTLDAGAIAIVLPDDLRIEHLEAEELQRRLAWTTGRLVFQGETLAEAVAEFNRYHGRKLVIADPRIAGRRVGGTFEVTDLESFVSALTRSLDVRVDESRPDIIRLFAAED